jgi:hypothetical protein
MSEMTQDNRKLKPTGFGKLSKSMKEAKLEMRRAAEGCLHIYIPKMAGFSLPLPRRKLGRISGGYPTASLDVAAVTRAVA